MNISSATIRHKRYSYYGWTLKDESSGTYVNTLNRGEIGLLLAHTNTAGDATDALTQVTNKDQSTQLTLDGVAELRIGTADNQYFFDATLIPTQSNISVRTCTEFPSYGRFDAIYFNTNTLQIGIFDADLKWRCFGGAPDSHDWREIKEIYGGDSASFKEN